MEPNPKGAVNNFTSPSPQLPSKAGRRQSDFKIRTQPSHTEPTLESKVSEQSNANQTTFQNHYKLTVNITGKSNPCF